MRVAESLAHIVFDRPPYRHVRTRLRVLGVLEKGTDIFCLHRDKWKFQELHAIRLFFIDLWGARMAFAGRGNQRRARPDTSMY